MGTMGQEARRRQRWKLILTIVTFIGLALLIFAVRKQIVETIQKLDEINTWALLLMVPLQIINYHAYTKLYQGTLTILGDHIDYKPMFRVQLELNFVNHILPSGGLSGFSYFGLRMRAHNIAASKATLVQFMRFILIFISFQALLIAGLLMLAIAGQANDLMILISGSLVTLLVVLTTMMAFVLGSKQRINAFSTFVTRGLNKVLHFFRRKHPETISVERIRRLFTDLHENYVVLQRDYTQLKQPLTYAFIANVTEVLTVYVVYLAFGQWVNPGAVIIAYAIANFAGLVSFLPGGIGIYEALMTGTLVAAGVPAGLSISVTVMYRVVSMVIQLVPGYYFYYRNLHKSSNHVIG